MTRRAPDPFHDLFGTVRRVAGEMKAAADDALKGVRSEAPAVGGELLDVLEDASERGVRGLRSARDIVRQRRKEVADGDEVLAVFERSLDRLADSLDRVRAHTSRAADRSDDVSSPTFDLLPLPCYAGDLRWLLKREFDLISTFSRAAGDGDGRPGRAAGPVSERVKGRRRPTLSPDHLVELVSETAFISLLLTEMEGRRHDADEDQYAGLVLHVLDAWEIFYYRRPTPEPIFRLLARADAAGPDVGPWLDRITKEVGEASDLDGAQISRRQLRVDLMLAGAREELTDEQVAILELYTDIVLLQRAVADDITRARRRAGIERPITEVLAEMDQEADFAYEDMLGHLLLDRKIDARVRPHDRSLLANYARSRVDFTRDGLFPSSREGGA